MTLDRREYLRYGRTRVFEKALTTLRLCCLRPFDLHWMLPYVWDLKQVFSTTNIYYFEVVTR